MGQACSHVLLCIKATISLTNPYDPAGQGFNRSNQIHGFYSSVGYLICWVYLKQETWYRALQFNLLSPYYIPHSPLAFWLLTDYPERYFHSIKHFSGHMRTKHEHRLGGHQIIKIVPTTLNEWRRFPRQLSRLWLTAPQTHDQVLEKNMGLEAWWLITCLPLRSCFPRVIKRRRHLRTWDLNSLWLLVYFSLLVLQKAIEQEGWLSCFADHCT